MIILVLISLFAVTDLPYISSTDVERVQGQEHVVSGFVGDIAVMPCEVDILNCGEVYLIKWFKNVSNGWREIFVYSDGVARGMGDFANPEKAIFLPNNYSAELILHGLTVQDEGKYKCDVTYARRLCPSFFITKLYTLNFIDLEPTEQGKKWPYKLVPYTLDSSFSDTERKVIESAMAEIKTRTCVEWIKWPSSEISDYVSVEKSSECKTQEGRVGGAQKLSLSSSCCMERGIILHLMLHTIGMSHEHQRRGRDNFITVNWDNIMDDHKHLFTKKTTDSLVYEYNYRSVLHFPSSLYAKNKSIPVLSPKHCDITAVELGNGFIQGHLTKLDIKNIRNFYRC